MFAIIVSIPPISMASTQMLTSSFLSIVWLRGYEMITLGLPLSIVKFPPRVSKVDNPSAVSFS